MQVRVKLSDPAWRAVGERELLLRLNTSSVTVGEAMKELASRYPSLKRELFDEEGGLDLQYNLFLNGKLLVGDAREEQKVAEGDELLLLLPMAGGALQLRRGYP